MAENIKKNHLNYSKQNLTKRATFSLCNTCPANYYLNFSYYLCVVGHLDMCASRYHTDAFFIFSTQRALHNSLKKFQNPKKDHSLVPYPGHKLSDPGHSSNTFRLDSSWPHSSSLLNRFLPGVTGELHKLKHNIFKAQSIPQKSTKIMAQNKVSQYIRRYHNLARML